MDGTYANILTGVGTLIVSIPTFGPFFHRYADKATAPPTGRTRRASRPYHPSPPPPVALGLVLGLAPGLALGVVVTVNPTTDEVLTVVTR